MISAIIPTLDAAGTLPECLNALIPAVGTLIKDVVVSDGGSTDATLDLADAAGALVTRGVKGRGAQLAAGAALARGDYFLFLHADTVLDQGWTDEVAQFLKRGGEAGVFTLAFDDDRARARLVAAGAMARTRYLKLPYGDQGLLIRAALYRALGGYRLLPIMEDVDFMERLIRARGRDVLTVFSSRAVTSAARYQNGYARRVLRNAWCVLQYRLGVAPEKIAASYHKS